MTAAQISRRDFLVAALLSSAFTAAAQDARMVGVVPLGEPGAASPPFGRLLGDGLDARLFTDLSQLGNPQSLVTSNDKFFVRSAAPSNLPPTARGRRRGWSTDRSAADSRARQCARRICRSR